MKLKPGLRNENIRLATCKILSRSDHLLSRKGVTWIKNDCKRSAKSEPRDRPTRNFANGIILPISTCIESFKSKA